MLCCDVVCEKNFKKFDNKKDVAMLLLFCVCWRVVMLMSGYESVLQL